LAVNEEFTKYGTMEPTQVSELKRIVQENARLKKLVAERDLEIEIIRARDRSKADAKSIRG